MTWLTAAQVLALPPGTAVVLELAGRGPRLRGRVAGRVADELTVETYGGRTRAVERTELVRGRVVTSVYEEGDPVLLVDTPAHAWRGGVVRSEGRQVLVEQSTGPALAWRDEAELERPEDRTAPALAALPPGPVPASA